MIPVTPSLVLDPADLRESFIRASGPGGQNVNKVSSAVELRFNVNTASLPEEVRQRLRLKFANQITQSGDIVINAQRFRSQERNREDARGRLIELLRKAAVRPVKRIATKPTKASKVRRREGKAKRAQVKQRRSTPRFEDH